jgi:hypothetical protein
MIPEQVDSSDMIALEELIDQLSQKYTCEGVKYLAHKRLSSFHKEEWLAEQSVEGTLQNSTNLFPAMPLMANAGSMFVQTEMSKDNRDTHITKLLLHLDFLDFTMLKDLTEYCIIHQFTCTIKNTSWKSAFLVEIQKRQESLTEIKTVVERNLLAEA